MKFKDRFKFRAWAKHVKMMLYTHYNDGSGSLDVLKDAEAYPDDFILMQCTGLKDKNRKLIFESDICLWHTTEANLNPTFEIKWSEEMACWLHGHRPIRVVFESGFYQPVSGRKPYPGEGLEIIGNIHENPELLKANT